MIGQQGQRRIGSGCFRNTIRHRDIATRSTCTGRGDRDVGACVQRAFNRSIVHNRRGTTARPTIAGVGGRTGCRADGDVGRVNQPLAVFTRTLAHHCAQHGECFARGFYKTTVTLGAAHFDGGTTADDCFVGQADSSHVFGFA